MRHTPAQPNLYAYYGEWHMNYNSIRNDVRNMPTILIIFFFFRCLFDYLNKVASQLPSSNYSTSNSQHPASSKDGGKFIPMMKLKDILIILYTWSSFISENVFCHQSFLLFLLHSPSAFVQS